MSMDRLVEQCTDGEMDRLIVGCTEQGLEISSFLDMKLKLNCHSPLPVILMNLNMNLNSKFTLLSRCEVEFPIQLTPILMN